MTTTAGKTGRIKVGSNTIAEVTDASCQQNQAVVDDTAVGDEWDTHNTTRKNWTGSGTAWFDSSDSTGQGALTIGASVTWNYYPEGDSTGDPEWTGTATVTSRGSSFNKDGNTGITFTLQGNGALTEGTVS